MIIWYQFVEHTRRDLLFFHTKAKHNFLIQNANHRSLLISAFPEPSKPRHKLTPLREHSSPRPPPRIPSQSTRAKVHTRHPRLHAYRYRTEKLQLHNDKYSRASSRRLKKSRAEVGKKTSRPLCYRLLNTSMSLSIGGAIIYADKGRRAPGNSSLALLL